MPLIACKAAAVSSGRFVRASAIVYRKMAEDSQHAVEEREVVSQKMHAHAPAYCVRGAFAPKPGAGMLSDGSNSPAQIFALYRICRMHVFGVSNR